MSARLLPAALIAALLPLGCGSASAPTPTAATSLRPLPTVPPVSAWHIAYADSFGEPDDIWTTGQLRGGLSVSDVAGSGLLLVARGHLDHLEFAPSAQTGASLRVVMTASLTDVTSQDAVIGAGCIGRGGNGYAFSVGRDGSWTVTALPVAGITRVIAEGTLTASATAVRVGEHLTFDVSCIRETDDRTGATTDLTFSLNGHQLAHTRDRWSVLAGGSAWLGSVLVVSGTDGAVSALVSSYQESVLGA